MINCLMIDPLARGKKTSGTFFCARSLLCFLDVSNIKNLNIT